MAQQTTDTPRRENPSKPAPGSRIGATRDVLATLHGEGQGNHSGILDEVIRRSAGTEYDPSELVEPSIKISRRGFSQQRYGGCLSWQPDQRGGLWESALRAAPTESVRAQLADERSEAAEWLRRSARFFTCAAYDFDLRSYKLYQFRHRPVHFLEDLDLVAQQQQLASLSYIRSLELQMDSPAPAKLPLYFKLRYMSLGDPQADTTEGSRPHPLSASAILQPTYAPHPQLSPKLLQDVAGRDAITTALAQLLGDFVPGEQPVVKLALPRRADEPGTSPLLTAEDFRALDYGVSVNLLTPGPLRTLSAARDAILSVATEFGCAQKAKAWCDQMDPFGCFLSYIGIGPDSVTFYYRSTNFIPRHASSHRTAGTPAHS